jgi:hypothetical protein
MEEGEIVSEQVQLQILADRWQFPSSFSYQVTIESFSVSKAFPAGIILSLGKKGAEDGNRR